MFGSIGTRQASSMKPLSRLHNWKKTGNQTNVTLILGKHHQYDNHSNFHTNVHDRLAIKKLKATQHFHFQKILRIID